MFDTSHIDQDLTTLYGSSSQIIQSVIHDTIHTRGIRAAFDLYDRTLELQSFLISQSQQKRLIQRIEIGLALLGRLLFNENFP